MKHDINAFNLLRFGLLPGIAILIFTLVITAQWSITLELLVVAAVPLLLGCLVLTWMFASFGSDIHQRLNDSIEKAQYLRPSYILCMFVLVSMTVAVLHILLGLSANITLPLTLGMIVLSTLISHKLRGHSPQAVPFAPPHQEEYIPKMDYGYRGYREDCDPGQTPQQCEDLQVHEQPQAQYLQSMPPLTR